RELAASAHTLLATTLESNAQAIAIFFIIIPQVSTLPTRSSFCFLFQAKNQHEERRKY
ncbi:hypothetical protein SEEM6152_07951, partial [Salmonella enterica subsp. enterica serovar Montevideo str. 556152]